MSLTTKSPRAVALQAPAAGEAALPLYSHLRPKDKGRGARPVRYSPFPFLSSPSSPDGRRLIG